MSEFKVVARLSEIPNPGRKLIEADGRLVVLCRKDSEVYCLDDVCTHDGGPLGSGELQGYDLICPRHGARFDIRTGCARTMPATEPTRTHAVRVEGDQILVQWADDDS
jgi:3-phenylpropionate/trans-cinnamate dioxygenase ferredoxin subunit